MVAGWAKGDGRVAGVEDGGRNVLDALDGHRTAVHEDHRRRYACGAGRLEHGQRELLLQLGRRDVRAVVLLALVPARIVCATQPVVSLPATNQAGRREDSGELLR